jgi:tripartite-type tricarboxylate transporter receptor subunit TctC
MISMVSSLDRWTRLITISIMLAAAVPAAAQSNNFPTRPIRIIMPFTPGGPTDMIARVLAQGLGSRIDQSVIVENRAGANGILGTSAVAKAPADGYTLLLAPTSHAINPGLYKSLPYNTLRDFRSVIYVGNSPGLVLVVNGSSPFNSVRQLVAEASKPDSRIAFGSAGVGNITHLAGEVFNRATGAKTLHVPYKGAGEILSALYGGDVQFAFLGPPQAAELMKAKKLRALAVTSAKRIPQLPDVPAIGELGYADADFDGGIQAAVYAPAATPQPVIDKLNAEFNAVLADPSVKARFEPLAMDIAGGPPEVLDRKLHAVMERYARILREANIQPE